MSNVGGSRSVRSRAYARLVREQTSFDTVNKARAAYSAENRVEVERVLEDFAEHRRDVCDVERDNNQSREHIEDTHNGNNLLRDFDDTLAAAENAKSDSRRNHGADNQRRPGRPLQGK